MDAFSAQSNTTRTTLFHLSMGDTRRSQWPSSAHNVGIRFQPYAFFLARKPFFATVCHMRLHRFIGPFDFRFSPQVITDDRIVYQVRQVLRLNPREKLILVDGKGKEAVGVIRAYQKKGLVVDIETVTDHPENNRPVTLYCALLKKDNFELVVQKATEVGISTIVPVVTAHTIKKGIRPIRLYTIAVEAAEQCGRQTVPTIIEPHMFAAIWSRMTEYKETSLFCDYDGKPWQDSSIPKQHPIAIIIGPEGGWNEQEKDLARQHNATMLTLGATVLRAETAAIIASYLAVNFGA